MSVSSKKAAGAVAGTAAAIAGATVGVIEHAPKPAAKVAIVIAEGSLESGAAEAGLAKLSRSATLPERAVGGLSGASQEFKPTWASLCRVTRSSPGRLDGR
jgi:hypothetical protein